MQNIQLSDNYLLVKTLHSSNVYIDKITDEMYLLKEYQESSLPLIQRLQVIKNENNKLQIPFIHEIFKEGEYVYAMIEYIKGETLTNFLDNNKDYIDENKNFAYDVTEQLTSALSILNDNEIIHRDIKPDNIIIKIENSTVKAFIIDFNISRLYKPTQTKDTEHFGTREFAAPEAYGYQQTDYKSDIYSLGKTFEFIKDKLSLNNNSFNILINEMTEFNPDQCPNYKYISSNLITLYRLSKKKPKGSTTREFNNEIEVTDNEKNVYKKKYIWKPYFYICENFKYKIVVNVLGIGLIGYFIYDAFNGNLSEKTLDNDNYINQSPILKSIVGVFFLYLSIVFINFISYKFHQSKFNNYIKMTINRLDKKYYYNFFIKGCIKLFQLAFFAFKAFVVFFSTLVMLLLLFSMFGIIK